MWVPNYKIVFGITSRQLKAKVKQQVLHFVGKHPMLSGGASRFAWQLREAGLVSLDGGTS